MRAIAITLVGAIALCFEARAQVAGTAFFMNSLPQYVNANPAFVPRYKFSLGLPFSMIDVSYNNNGFNYNDFVRRENGRNVADLARLSSLLPQKTYITTTSQLDLFRLGLRLGSGMYLSVNSTVHGYARAMIPKDAIALAANGNAAYVGTTASISPEFEGTGYIENSVGLAVSPTDRLTVGARAKLLFGMANVTTERAQANIAVADSYAVTMNASLDAKTSGLKSFDNGLKVADIMANKGLALDLGATYRVLDKLTVSASLVDIGYISWKNDTKSYTLDPTKATYTFSGVDVGQLIDGNTQYGQSLSDSLNAKFKPEEAAGSAYKTMLPSKAYLGATYQVMKNFSVGGVFYTETYRGRVAPGWTLAANKHFGRILSTTVSYTMSNRSFNNLGAGLSLNLAPVQIYVVGDNLLRLPISTAMHQRANEYINSTQVFNLRLGVNFVWGWLDDSGKRLEDKPNKGPKKSKVSTDKNKQPKASHIDIRKKK